MTQTELDTIAPTMDRAARELAHANGHDTPAKFVRAYALAVAETCGALAADQCADGEEWAPADWLTGDIEAVEEACDLVGIDLGDIIREAWALYVAPSPSAFDVQGLARR